jgi:hypothetical protein
MGFESIGDNIVPILIVLGLILLQVVLGRKRRGEKTKQGIIQSLLLELRVNQALVDTYYQREKPKTFEVTSWQMYKNKLDFISQSLQVALSDAYMIMEDYNQQIKAAKKFKSTSYIVGIDLKKLEEPMNKSREGLEQWLLSATGTKEPRQEFRSMFDDLLGRR